jgi:hypothetical protein
VWRGTGEFIKLLRIDIWHYPLGRVKRLYQNIVYWDMALYCGEGQVKLASYCVLSYGIILSVGEEKLSNYCALRCGIKLWGGTGERIKILCIDIWYSTVGDTGNVSNYCVI